MLIQNCVTYIRDTYKFLIYDLADPRTNNWFLVTHPYIFLIVGVYVYFVTKLGPRLMKNRKPFELNRTMVVYNLIQVIASVYIFVYGLDAGWLRDYSYKCQPVDFSNNPKAIRAAWGCWIYYIAKISELLDTVFFVLRKKEKQITFLHLYHHSVMPMISWGVTKYFPGGHGTLIGLMNSFVHIIMYSYYLLAAMGPHIRKYLWWKKYITTLQLLQFCVAFIHSMQLLYYDCGYPRWSTFFTLPNAIFFYYLFNDFYNKSYSFEKGVEKYRNSNGEAKAANGYAKKNA